MATKAKTRFLKWKLYEGIPSQVIWKENISNPAFNLFLPNIQIAILSKLRGVPRRLKRDTTNELIVGVYAFYSITPKSKYVGSAFCFNTEGIFKGFDCFGAKDMDSIAGSIREAVGKFISSNYKGTKRILTSIIMWFFIWEFEKSIQYLNVSIGFII